MKKIRAVLDLSAFMLSGAILAAAAAVIFAGTYFRKKRRYTAGAINRFSFAIFDLISNKYDSMLEDALLGGYISKDHYIYLDFENRRDRHEVIQDRIFFHTVAAHPGTALYNAGFRKTSSVMVELKMLAKAFAVVRKNDITFIKTHDPHLLGLNGLLTARIFGLPCVLHMNSDFEMKYRGIGKTSSPVFISRGIERWFESFIIGSMDLVMADRNCYRNSRTFPRRSVSKYKAFGVRVEKTHYTPPPPKTALKEKMGLAGKKVLLYVGRLHPVKYPEDAVKAFRLVAESIDDAALVMVGAGSMKGPLEEMTRRDSLEGRVIFLGNRTYREIKDIFAAADVFLAPHGGVTLLESALAGTPIVAYDFDWHPEFIEDGKMGRLVPFRDVAAMAQGAKELLEDDALRQKMGSYCRKIALSRYPRERSLANEKSIYEDLLKR